MLQVFKRGAVSDQSPDLELSGIAKALSDFSIEVTPRTAAKIEDLPALLPRGTRVYIAHIDGTPIEDMVATARRLHQDGFEVVPHFPARSIRNEVELRDWIDRYQSAADVRRGLILAGGRVKPCGAFASSMDLLRTGLFGTAGFTHLDVAGHPEGNKDIDPDGGHANLDAFLLWKQGFAQKAGIDMAIVTQFCFSAEPVTAWIAHLRAIGVTLPVHVGVAGPAKLQTLIKYAITCGVGASIAVVQKRAKDATKLLMPFEPTSVLADFAREHATGSGHAPDRIHFFPLGGIRASADYVRNIVALSETD